MIVTRFNYSMDKMLVSKLDLLVKRCIQKNPKKDAVLIVEGAEGEGKSTLSVAIAYYASEQMKREFSHKNIFFDLEKMIDFAKNTDHEIIIWDEPSAQAMSGDTGKKIVKNLFRLLQMCRKKRHFIIINMTYFTMFKDYIVWQRPNCMIHVYSRSESEPGRFGFIRKKKLEKLWMDWHRKKQRNYFKYTSRNCRGSFPDVLNPEYRNNVLSEFDYDSYDKEKEAAIRAIGEEEVNKNDMKVLALKYRLSQLPKILKIEVGIITKALGLKHDSLNEWKKLGEKYPILLEKEPKSISGGERYYNRCNEKENNYPLQDKGSIEEKNKRRVVLSLV